MTRRILAMMVLLVAVVAPGGALADDKQRTPVPEAGVLAPIKPGTCIPDSRYDAPDYYGQKCSRLSITFGPIFVKPGQNDLLIQPVVFEKPLREGYAVRFQPSLVEGTGVAPPVEQLHLHHGTWLNAGRSYGDGPWIASGEEKTIVAWPYKTGLLMQPSDQWLFLHMVHNATAVPRPVWVTYDIDYVAKADGDAMGMQGTRSIWLDVGNCGGSWHPKCESYPYNPVYNTQKGFGSVDPDTGLLACSYPDVNCARHNSLNRVSAQQGLDVSDEVPGKDYKVTKSSLGGATEGTLVVMGGHLHTGGIRDEVSLVRDLDADGVYEKSEEKMILLSEAYYWDWENPDVVGGPGADPRATKAYSWDFSMTGVTALPPTEADPVGGWRIRVKEGDRLRLNAIYETQDASWYENMGIVMTWLVPGNAPNYTPGLDPFDPNVRIDAGIPTTAQRPEFGPHVPAAMQASCVQDGATICTRGQVTHGHYSSGNNHTNCPPSGCPALPGASIDGPDVTDIQVGGFTYGVADFGVIGLSGIPQAKLGEPVTFWNADTTNNMWHTITRCAAPCTGPTSTHYPVADGGTGADDVMDFDSAELGAGLSIPNNQGPDGSPVGVNYSWTLTPTQTGTFTFFCRIHPSMRGAIEVVA